MAGPQFISIDEAARRSGRSPGHLKRLCNQRWHAQGLARQTRSSSNQRTWEIREDADPSLSPVKFPEQLDREFDLSTLTEKHRRLLLQRKQTIDGWIEAREAGAKLGNFTEEQITSHYITRLEIQQGVSVSRRTLFNWHREYRARGLAGLVDERWRTAEKVQEDDPFFDELKRLYLDPRQRSKAFCYDAARDLAEERGWKVPSYRTACRYLDRLPLRTVKLYREGDKGYKAVGPYVERDYESIASNDIWWADHHRLDLMCEHEGKFVRPWLTAWMDARSRKFVGWRIVAHAPNSDTIYESFVDAVHPQRNDHGLPRCIYIDNGEDFAARDLHGMTKAERRSLLRSKKHRPKINAGLFARMDIQVKFALPYHPQTKTIERHFRVVSERFAKSFETYTGNTPANKPHDLLQMLQRGKAPTLDEVIAAWRDFLDGWFHVTPKEGHGMRHEGRQLSPAEAWRTFLVTKRTAPVADLEEMLLKETEPLSVGRLGVRVKSLGGLTYGRNLPELIERQGKAKVIVKYSNDVRAVRIYDTDGRFVCIAHANEMLPPLADHQAVREAQQEARRDRRIHKQFLETRPRLTDSLPDRMYRTASRRRAQQQDDGDLPPPSIEPVRSRNHDQLPALRKAIEQASMRPAVGAESISLADLRPAISTASEAANEDPFAALGRALRRSEE